eukprot:scaffold11616_cov93-Isochrysis_galbana.AAC.2
MGQPKWSRSTLRVPRRRWPTVAPPWVPLSVGGGAVVLALDHRGRHGAREGPRVLLGPSSSAGVAADVEEHARRLEEGGAVGAWVD